MICNPHFFVCQRPESADLVWSGGRKGVKMGPEVQHMKRFKTVPNQFPAANYMFWNYFGWWAASLPPWIDEKGPANEFQGAVGGVLAGARRDPVKEDPVPLRHLLPHRRGAPNVTTSPSYFFASTSIY